MITLLKIFPDKWEQARGYLRLDLEAIEAAMNQRWSVTFGATNLLRADTIAGDHSEDTRYVSNEGTDHEPLWAQINLSNGVKNRLPFSNFVAATAGSRLVGRGSASGAGDFEEISLGSGLMMQGTTLSVNPAGFPIQEDFYSSYDPWTTGGGINTGQSLSTGFTTGSVLFAGPAGVVSQDNANFFWDDTNNRLGIGTTSPSAGLHLLKTFSTDQAVGMYADIFHNTATAGTVYGGRYDATCSHSSGTMNNTIGLINSARYAGTGTALATSLQGMQCFICLDDVASPQGTITTATGVALTNIGNFATGTPAVTISQARGLTIGDIGSGNGSNGLTVSNSCAMSIAGSQTAASNTAVINISNTTSVPFAPSGTWSIYNASTRNNHEAGPTYVGHTSTWGSGTNFISFADGTAPGTPASNTAAIYADDVSGTTKMFAIHEDGVAGQIAQLAGNLTSGRVALVTTNGQLTDDAGITYNATDNRINVDQVRFPATQNPSSDANTLDDYEEGSWTPAVTFGGGNTGITYSNQVGRYVKMGRFVALSGLLTLSNKGSSTGNAVINGWPFTVGNDNGFFSSAKVNYSAFTAGVDGVALQTIINTATGFFTKDVTGTNTIMTEADFSNTSQCVMYICYQVD